MIKRRIVKWSERKYSAKIRLLFLILMGLFFALIIPYLLVLLSFKLDALLGLRSIYFGLANFMLGFILIIIGFSFSFWSVKIQFTEGRGTPAPMMPTQKLITDGPYYYCRNPMTFGIFLFYLGVSILIGSISFIIMVIIITPMLLIYVKIIEEKELESRFSAEYVEYKSRTPFFFPRLRSSKKK